MMTKKAIAVLSGGLDSCVATCVYAEDYEIHGITFNYGQKSFKQELKASEEICRKMGFTHEVIDLPWLNKISNSSLTSDNEIPTLTHEELDDLEEKFDVITSSLAFDYVENFERLMKQIYSHLNENGKCVFSMSHPISTAYDGTFDRYTRTETGERLYANLRNYGIEGKRVIHWVVDEYELYHRTISTLINDIVSAGFIIEECQESKVPESIREKRTDMFGGVIHQPDFIFFRCGKKN